MRRTEIRMRRGDHLADEHHPDGVWRSFRHCVRWCFGTGPNEGWTRGWRGPQSTCGKAGIPLDGEVPELLRYDMTRNRKRFMLNAQVVAVQFILEASPKVTLAVSTLSLPDRVAHAIQIVHTIHSAIHRFGSPSHAPGRRAHRIPLSTLRRPRQPTLSKVVHGVPNGRRARRGGPVRSVETLGISWRFRCAVRRCRHGSWAPHSGSATSAAPWPGRRRPGRSATRSSSGSKWG